MTRSNAQRTAETRSRLLESAVALFGDEGYERAALGAIARNAGLSVGAVYHHWANKEALFFDVVDDQHRRIALQSNQIKSQDAYDRVIGSGRIFLTVSGERRFARIMLYDGPSVLGSGWHELDERWWLEPTARLLRSSRPRTRTTERALADAAGLLGALTALGRRVAEDPRPVVVRSCRDTFERLVAALLEQRA